MEILYNMCYLYLLVHVHVLCLLYMYYIISTCVISTCVIISTCVTISTCVISTCVISICISTCVIISTCIIISIFIIWPLLVIGFTMENHITKSVKSNKVHNFRKLRIQFLWSLNIEVEQSSRTPSNVWHGLFGVPWNWMWHHYRLLHSSYSYRDDREIGKSFKKPSRHGER